MNKVWYVFPSANPKAAGRACAMWKAKGYLVAVAVDRGAAAPSGADLVLEVDYAGYYAAVRDLVRATMDATRVWVCGGDDIRPPDQDPVTLAADFERMFPDWFGVMQPTGDTNERTGRPFGGTGSAAVSPWIGRGWVERAYGGDGPHWCGYHHLYGDQELREVAVARGVYWERSDVRQFHEHWTRGCADNLSKERRKEIIDRWPADREIFEGRQREGFPGVFP